MDLCCSGSGACSPPTDSGLTKGLFLAPTIVGESLKGAILLAEVFGGTFGLPTNPPPPPPPVVDDTAADVNGDKRGAAAAAGGGGSVGAELGGGGVGGRTDIVQALELGDRDRLIKFCEAVQLFSPVNAYVRPGKPWWIGPDFFLPNECCMAAVGRAGKRVLVVSFCPRCVLVCWGRDGMYCMAPRFPLRDSSALRLAALCVARTEVWHNPRS